MTAVMLHALKLVHQLSTRSINSFFSNLRLGLLAYGVSKSQVEQMPQDPRSYENVIDLSFEEEILAICPKCSSAYPVAKDGLPSIKKCIYQTDLRSKKCGENLCRVVQRRLRPKLIFRRRKLDDWLKNIISRPSVIEGMDKAWNQAQGPPPEFATDFWGGSFVRELKGPDGEGLFSQVPENESRLLFSLSVDWFNPYHNKISGKSASSGVIVMACLNLPPEERYKEENIYLVGVLPGKKQQSRLDEFLRPLVDDLLRYWTDGVYFVGIPGHKRPHLIRAALVQLICDLPAARKVAGFPGHSARQNCSVCLTTNTNTTDFLSAHDPNMQRTRKVHLARARKYKEVLQSHGKKTADNMRYHDPQWVRWSPLNELPYWDPIKCTIEDSMHLILLGLCQFHWRRFWNGDNIFKSRNNPSHTPEMNSVGTRATGSTLTSISVGMQNGHKQHPDREEEASDSDELGNDQLDNEKEDIEEAIEVEAIGKQDTAHSLTPLKMREAREKWVYGSDKALIKLSIKQILCLLQENGGKVPSIYGRKSDLSKLLIVGIFMTHSYRKLTSLQGLRTTFNGLPKAPRKLLPLPKRRTRTSMNRSNLSGSKTLHQPHTTVSASERLLNNFDPITIPSVSRSDPGALKPAFITKAELEEVQRDIMQIVLPSSATKLQPNFGEKAHGKLKADEWRSLFAVYLPLTFMRLWLTSDGHRLHLKALLNLSLLVQIITSRTSSADGMKLYDSTIQNYLNLVSVLNPEAKLVVNHHLALHLSTFMRLHGPCRSHWAFPFERLIGKLQRVVRNSHIGQWACHNELN